jgi:hypothetical protein
VLWGVEVGLEEPYETTDESGERRIIRQNLQRKT